MINGLRKFQEFLVELGVARNVLALPAPRMLSLPSGSLVGTGSVNLFTEAVTEAEIVDVSRDLFASGHYNLAVAEAFKAVDKFVEKRTGTGLSGTKGMRAAFGPKKPVLVWSDRTSDSQADEQEGYDHMFSGAMLGIRNPCTHEFNWISDEKHALELLIFAQHLLRKAKDARTISSAKGGL